MARYEAIEDIMKNIDDELIVCNIGFPSRELYEIDDRDENFYMIGSMGLASSIGLGLALARPDKKIVVIDGDGSLLMNMGSLVTIYAANPSNLTWIVIDNGAYGSTGNQDTYAQLIDLVEIAKSVGFKNSYDFKDIDLKLDIFLGKKPDPELKLKNRIGVLEYSLYLNVENQHQTKRQQLLICWLALRGRRTLPRTSY